MAILTYFLLAVYAIALIFISFYCLLQFQLLYHYKQYNKVNSGKKYLKAELGDKKLPFVTIQLPVFNELYVVDRLVDSIMKLDYPRDKFQIQLLDDSTDETIEVSQKKVDEYAELGIDIKLYHREDRTGYKAGALKAAMPYAKGEFIAIFDADFIPKEDFLLTCIPYFSNPEIGVVQTRWQHINQEYSMLTKLQALQLNVHFTVEQLGRSAGNLMLQFNGTAGVWRRETIRDAGGWEADTLTEDLDLSYRAQLKGWKIHYLEKFGSPAELPAEMNGLKSQQFRWMKGGAENAKKLLPTVWKSDLTLKQKVHASGHLMSSSVFLFIFVAGLFSVPLIYFLPQIDFNSSILGIFLLSWISIIMVYYVANVQAEIEHETTWKTIIKFFFLFPVFLALSMGLSLHNSIAVIQGYIGKKSAFIRTPKFNIKGVQDSFKERKYLAKKIPWTTFGEGLLAAYFFGAIGMGIYIGNTSFLIFHVLLTIGYGSICYYSIRHLNA